MQVLRRDRDPTPGRMAHCTSCRTSEPSIGVLQGEQFGASETIPLTLLAQTEVERRALGEMLEDQPCRRLNGRLAAKGEKRVIRQGVHS